MGLVPDTKQGKITFFNSKTAAWTTNATAIGTTSTAVTAMAALVTDAQAKLAAQVVAKAAAKTAIDVADGAIDALAKAGADIISSIRTKARTGGDTVWELAQLPVPGTPAPRPAPGTPYKFEATLQPDGSLATKWKCTNPKGVAGTMYQIYRSIGGSTTFTIVGGSGQREFTDTTIPAGVTQLTYKIQAVRSTSVSPWATFNVFFGSNAGGGAFASVEAVPVKIAA